MLRYHHLDEIGRVPRTELQHGRRLKSDGVLSGALHTLGYYSTDVCIGSPAKRYDLIIDTGSSVTAVPCSTCRQCGTHHCGVAGRFDLKRSSTGQPVGCRSHSGLTCESCISNQCSYSVHYTEGSAIKGHVVSDIAHMRHTSASPMEADIPFGLRIFVGCQTLETGMFYKQVCATKHNPVLQAGVCHQTQSHSTSRCVPPNTTPLGTCLTHSSADALSHPTPPGGGRNSWPSDSACSITRAVSAISVNTTGLGYIGS